MAGENHAGWLDSIGGLAGVGGLVTAVGVYLSRRRGEKKEDNKDMLVEYQKLLEERDKTISELKSENKATADRMSGEINDLRGNLMEMKDRLTHVLIWAARNGLPDPPPYNPTTDSAMYQVYKKVEGK